MTKYHSNCLICDSNNILMLKGYEKYELAKCKKCSFVFMKAIPSLEELNNHYSTYSYGVETYLSPMTIKSYHKILDEFEKYRVSNKLLDLGCGVGVFLDEARKRGWEIYGTEYSKTALKLCEKRGIKMIDGKLDSSLFQDKNFDVITSFEVIEHINNPKEDVRELFKLLRPGGLFYCTTPNFNSALRFYLKDNYNIIAYPEHLAYYTKKTLHHLLTAGQLKRKKMLSTGISITRFKISSGSEERLIAEDSSDEKLRNKIDTNILFAWGKQFANFLLTITGTGMTLKAYYIKPGKTLNNRVRTAKNTALIEQ